MLMCKATAPDRHTQSPMGIDTFSMQRPLFLFGTSPSQRCNHPLSGPEQLEVFSPLVWHDLVTIVDDGRNSAPAYPASSPRGRRAVPAVIYDGDEVVPD